MTDTPQILDAQFHKIDAARLFPNERASHAPRILLLYGALRARSFSRLMTEEAVRVLECLGAEIRSFDPAAAR